MQKRLLPIGLVLLAFGSSASDETVHFGVEDANVTVIDSVAEAAYRQIQPGWDQMLSNGDDPWTGNNLTTNDFTGATALNGITWDFSITYESGDDGVQGFTFVMNEVDGSRTGSLVYDVNNPLNLQTPTGAFNAIMIEAFAGELLDPTSYVESAYMDISDLAFTSTLPSSGVIENPLSAYWPSPGNTEERKITWIASNADLSSIDWVLTGTVTGGHDCNGLGSAGCLSDDSVRMSLKFAEATVVLPEVFNVQIDVLPGDAANKVYPNKTGKLPVAVLSSAEFDGTQVDPATLKLGPAEASIAEAVSIEDADGANGNDTLARFNVEETGILCNDTEVVLSGETYAGEPIAGFDTIDATECETGGCHAY